MSESSQSPPARSFSAMTSVFTRSEQTGEVDLPAGARLVLLQRGEPPFLLPVDDPGTYEVRARDATPDDSAMPIAIAAVPLANLDAWLALSVETVGRMIDRCALAAMLDDRAGHA